MRLGDSLTCFFEELDLVFITGIRLASFDGHIYFIHGLEGRRERGGERGEEREGLKGAIMQPRLANED
jgi:hypothetical protein